MLNINFVDQGSDESLLKSMADDELHEYNQDELEKAMNRAKLVQKEIQYKTKNGKIATRKQWVSAGVEQKKGKPTAKKEEPKNEGKPGQTMTRKERLDAVKNLKDGEDFIVSGPTPELLSELGMDELLDYEGSTSLVYKHGGKLFLGTFASHDPVVDDKLLDELLDEPRFDVGSKPKEVIDWLLDRGFDEEWLSEMGFYEG